jgi:multiple sugar transport system permease protein
MNHVIKVKQKEIKYRPKKSMLQKEYKHFLMFTGISLLGFLLFYFYPIVRTLMLSFTDTEGIGVGEANFVGLQNFAYALLSDDLFMLSMKQSMIFAFVSGVLVLVTSLLMAMLLNSKVKGIGVFRIIYFIPFIIPSFAVGAVYKNIFDPATGMVNEILRFFNPATLPGWYKSTETALVTMIIISAFGFGIKMVIFLAALQNVPKTLYEVADIEGASSFQKFWHITLPVISPVIFFNVVLTTIDGLKAFNLAFVMGNGSGFPANSTLLFPIYMFMTAFNYPYRLGYAAAMAWIFFVLIMFLTLINFALSKIYVKEE